MSGLAKLGDRLYFDANIYIYAVEGFVDWRPTVGRLFQYAEADGRSVIASQALLVELLPKPLARSDQIFVNTYRTMFEKGQNIRLVDIDHSVAMTAVDMCARHNLRPVDGLHLATALVHDCTAFVTNDRTLARVDDLPVFLLADLAPA